MLIISRIRILACGIFLIGNCRSIGWVPTRPHECTSARISWWSRNYIAGSSKWMQHRSSLNNDELSQFVYMGRSMQSLNQSFAIDEHWTLRFTTGLTAWKRRSWPERTKHGGGKCVTAVNTSFHRNRKHVIIARQKERNNKYKALTVSFSFFFRFFLFSKLSHYLGAFHDG